MAQLEIELDGRDGHFELEAELSGKLYTLEFMWNTRAGIWTAAIREYQADEYIVSGYAVRSGWALFKERRDVRLPPGKLLVIDTGGTDADPLQDDLGVRVLLVYDDGE